MIAEPTKGWGPVIRAAAFTVAPVLGLWAASMSLVFGGGVQGLKQGAIAVALGLAMSMAGFLFSRSDRCPRCRRVTEVAEDVQGTRLCAPCWLDEMGRPRKHGSKSGLGSV
jgi:hypothetical protein